MSYQKHNFEAGAVLLASQLNEMDDEIELLGQKESSLSDNFKEALLNCFENVAWANDDGQAYYEALYNSLYPDENVQSISALFNQGSAIIYTNDSLNILRQYLTVTATYEDSSTAVVTGYSLSGELIEGTSTITVEYGGKTTTFNVLVTQAPGLYTITNNLTNCTTSNDSSTITEGSSYSAIIVANQGYSLEGATVSIFMGGNDVTNLYYTGGSINIPNVTGNLVINVTAVTSVSSISAVFTPAQDRQITLTPTRINSYITSDGKWSTASDSYCICIPVTIGREYVLSLSSSDSSVVGTIFKCGFSSTNTPSNQYVRNWNATTPQDNQTIKATAVQSYMVIQLSSSYAESIITNGYLTITELSSKIYTNDSLYTLRQYLTVTATYQDSTTQEIDGYELSGTLEEGTSTITVEYGGATTTFNVSCTVRGWLYHFNNSILSSGSKDFGLEGVENYEEGLFGRNCYAHLPESLETDPLGLKALNVPEYPDMGIDFTLSLWLQQDDYSRTLQFNPIFATIYTGSGNPSSNYISASTKESTWTISHSDHSGKGLSGFAIQGYQGKFIFRIMNSANTASNQLAATCPNVSTFNPQAWHHYAVTRKDNQIRMFVDGVLLTVAVAAQTTVYHANQVAIASYFIQSSADKSNLQAQGFGMKIQDLYISDFCKWENSFDPQTIKY